MDHAPSTSMIKSNPTVEQFGWSEPDETQQFRLNETSWFSTHFYLSSGYLKQGSYFDFPFDSQYCMQLWRWEKNPGWWYIISIARFILKPIEYLPRPEHYSSTAQRVPKTARKNYRASCACGVKSSHRTQHIKRLRNQYWWYSANNDRNNRRPSDVAVGLVRLDYLTIGVW